MEGAVIDLQCEWTGESRDGLGLRLTAREVACARVVHRECVRRSADPLELELLVHREPATVRQREVPLPRDEEARCVRLPRIRGARAKPSFTSTPCRARFPLRL